MAKISPKNFPELLKRLEKEQLKADKQAKQTQVLLAKMKRLKAGSLKLKQELGGEED